MVTLLPRPAFVAEVEEQVRVSALSSYMQEVVSRSPAATDVQSRVRFFVSHIVQVMIAPEQLVAPLVTVLMLPVLRPSAS